MLPADQKVQASRHKRAKNVAASDAVKDQTARERKALHRAAMRRMRERYPELDLALSDIAGDLGTSTRQLQRVFIEVGGRSFREALLEVRMKEARRLLTRQRSPLPVRAVALRVGYRKPSGLRQAFVRYWGCNPSEVQPEPPDELWMEVDVREART